MKTRVYSLGDYRRKVLGGAKSVPADYFQTKSQSSSLSRLSSRTQADLLLLLIAPRSEDTNALRRRIKTELEEQIWDFFTVHGGQVVIYDANNGNINAREDCMDKFRSRGVHVIFLGQLSEIPIDYLFGSD